MNFNYFESLNAEEKFKFRENNYYSMFLSMLCNMFQIEGLKNSEKNFLMATLYTHGTCLIKKEEDKYILCAGNFCNIPKPTEIYPTRYIAVKNDFEYDNDIMQDETATVCYINQFLAPCTELFWYCEQFADIDTSLKNNILYSRISPIACVQDDETLVKYEECIERMMKGELINSLLTYINMSDGKPSQLTTIDISRAEYAEKIQYLSAYHEQLLSRFFKMFGISYNYISKQANITAKELDNTDDFASMLPLYMKDCLNEGLEKIGLKAEFTKTWKWIDNIDKATELEKGLIDNVIDEGSTKTDNTGTEGTTGNTD